MKKLLLTFFVIFSFGIPIVGASPNLEDIAHKMRLPMDVHKTFRSTGEDFGGGILETFNNLTIDEKNEVLRLMRLEDDGFRNSADFQKKEEYIDGIEEYARKKGKSVADLTEREVDKYNYWYRTIRGPGDWDPGLVKCMSAYFPDAIYYEDPSISARLYSGVHVKSVRNTNDIDDCDYAIKYKINANKFFSISARGWGMSSLPFVGFGGKLNKQTQHDGDWVIVGAGRANLFYGGTEWEVGQRIRQDIQLWK